MILGSKSGTALIVGCGDIGLRVARRLIERGLTVRGQVRSAASAEALSAAGVAPVLADLDTDDDADESIELLFWFAPPPPSGDTDPRLRRWLARNRAERLVYLSTSGVYGDCAGRWIDESEPLKPQTDRARRRLDAERALAGHDHAVILRVPGIYGPGRLPLERLRQNLPVVREDQCPPSNRIHAEDLADAAVAAAEHGTPGAAYNVSDGNPTSMTDYFLRCAALLGLPEPPRVSLEEARRTFTPAMLSFLEESKRLDTRRMREELGVLPRYPDLESGLSSCT